ncbi:MAG: hypothetical protein RMJ15_00665 [Nitrososphaerota archaeon]|nr:hypothetical protein [Nitrososphaerota archaeon]
MAGSTIDHIVATVIFLAALLIFIGLFNQMIQTAVLYQRNRTIATKCSDLLDNMLLNPGYPLEYANDSITRPIEWGRLSRVPTIFGLQDPEFTEYRLSPFSLMRLYSSIGKEVYYSSTGQYYSNTTMGFGSFLLVSSANTLNDTTVATLLGINNTYGFQLVLTPLIQVSIIESCEGNPLSLNLTVTGNGIPLANALVSYMLITVENGEEAPLYIAHSNVSFTDNEGSCILSFQNVNASESYAFIAYAFLGGLVGVGHRQRIMAESYIIPLVENISKRHVILAHSYDICNAGASFMSYNATFIVLNLDFSLFPMPFEDSVGEVVPSGYANLTIPTFKPGILAVAYQQSDNKTGVVLMPWGVSPLGFPVVFGSDPSDKTWVATDIRHVLVGGVAYQAKLALWSLEGYGVMG